MLVQMYMTRNASIQYIATHYTRWSQYKLRTFRIEILYANTFSSRCFATSNMDWKEIIQMKAHLSVYLPINE